MPHYSSVNFDFIPCESASTRNRLSVQSAPSKNKQFSFVEARLAFIYGLHATSIHTRSKLSTRRVQGLNCLQIENTKANISFYPC